MPSSTISARAIAGAVAGTISETTRTFGKLAPNFEWLKQFGTPKDDRFRNTALDSAGNLYLTGDTYLPLIGTNPSTNAWVTKYDSTGSQLWLKQLGGSNNYPSEVTVNSAGSVYRTGSIASASPQATFNDFDAWVAKYDNTGSQLWLKQFVATTPDFNDYPSDLAVDSVGNVYISGTSGYTTSGAGGGPKSAWVAKYDDSGNQLWLKDVNADTHDISDGIKVDSSGNVYLTGTNYNFSKSYPPDVHTWAAKYDSNGNQLWLKQFGTITEVVTPTPVPTPVPTPILISTPTPTTTPTPTFTPTPRATPTPSITPTPNPTSTPTPSITPTPTPTSTATPSVTPTPLSNSSPIIGTDGDDILPGDRSNDTISGKQGNDTLSGLDGNDWMQGHQGSDFLEGSNGDDTLYGGKGNDTLLAGNGENVLFGDGASDSLTGGEGNDTLYGGQGNDTLFGSLGNDCLIGGLGSDRFLLGLEVGTDTILDFEDEKDLLTLASGITFSQLAITQSNSATLIRFVPTGEILASVSTISASQINAADFTFL